MAPGQVPQIKAPRQVLPTTSAVLDKRPHQSYIKRGRLSEGAFVLGASIIAAETLLRFLWKFCPNFVT